jgi:hypothetical protein
MEIALVDTNNNEILRQDIQVTICPNMIMWKDRIFIRRFKLNGTPQFIEEECFKLNVSDEQNTSDQLTSDSTTSG